MHLKEAATETTAAEGEKETTTSAETGENDSPPVLHEEIPTNTSEEGQVEDTREQSSAGAIIGKYCFVCMNVSRYSEVIVSSSTSIGCDRSTR